MKYLEAKARRGAPQNKALGGAPENKDETHEGDGAVAGVQFASPAAKTKAEEAGLTAESFKRKRKSSDKGFTLADVERIASASAPDDEETEG